MTGGKLTNDEVSALCLGLSLLLHAGVGVGDGLSLLADEEPNTPYGELLRKLALEADDGIPLAQSFKDSGAFPDYVTGLLDIGERSGRMEETLAALSRYYEDRSRLNQQIRSALTYPAMLLVIMLAVIGVLLVQVLPVFNDVYAQLGGSLTGLAGWLLGLGQGLGAAMPVLCILLGAVVVVLIIFAASPGFRDRAMGLWRSWFGDKGVSRKINDARMAQSLSMGLASGLPLEEALELTAELMEGTPAAKERCVACLKELEDGKSLADAARDTELMPRAESRLLDLGMRSGTGDAVMSEIARRLTEESEIALEQRVAQVEPALVVVTSILVGVILLSVMLPLMNIMTAIG